MNFKNPALLPFGLACLLALIVFSKLRSLQDIRSLSPPSPPEPTAEEYTSAPIPTPEIAAEDDRMAAVVIKPLEKHTATVIFLHGLGDSGHGWSPVMQMLRSKHIKYVCPHAPEQRVTLNMGMKMPAWFDIFGLAPTDKEDAPGIKKSSDLLKQLVQKEIDSGIPSDRIVIGGFSQGCAVSLYTALTYDKPLAGVIALSGWLPLRDEFPAALNKEATANVPIFQAHGDADQVVSFNWGKSSNELLKSFGLHATFKVYLNMPHSACDEEIIDMKAFLHKVLP